ncbi:hypothetical protein IFM89_034474 [Coptis chinensis]|uniref:Uncharacterized protein n=1 Tax=Coptis chinensis TaxID=261450 RepID=A0A835IWN6_9MAGN|nr:hypothetical protein IFM89_034474 [Coptis chinensis]
MSPQNTLKSHIDTGSVSGQLSFARESRKISKLFPPIPELKSTPRERGYSPPPPESKYLDSPSMQDPARLKANGIIVGWGQQRLLDYVKLNYKNPAAIIHENGLPMTSDDSSNLAARNDTVRIKLLQIYIKNLHPSIRNGSNLGGYFLWSFLDVFQVTGGYTSHFGLYGVDFHDKERRRYPRQLVEWLHYLGVLIRKAKGGSIFIRLVSAAGTGFFYVKRNNPRKMTEKLEFRKYDPTGESSSVVYRGKDEVRSYVLSLGE